MKKNGTRFDRSFFICNLPLHRLLTECFKLYNNNNNNILLNV